MTAKAGKSPPNNKLAPGNCVVCGKPRAADYAPFCSARCTDVDLHRWLSGGYRIPTNEAPGEEEKNDEETDEY
ncbi:MAG: DNA gyrase inhibitor YacG [Alphaproteobacteria bacterium]|nr:DNA gyrase inhibitor YacG [Alphaproteobacteria bacterium]